MVSCRAVEWRRTAANSRQILVASDIGSDDEEVGCRYLEILGELGELHRLALARTVGVVE